ncbi:YggT family protein [Spiribacter vilamensis]|uniref:YggT family protein n=1 Tax=Spiribacter vilamensis TaxID=531306 RepID=A0A4Q8D1T0_9GAMM|nr:YggT family protein [Spiribacter vilamensis]RZU99220.1 YggT family protein [Spiribacter vilamensis]TVO61792.1 YggT family protein [Spiribacter vilamensis]
MGSGYLANPLAFLVDTVFSLYIMAVMLRFLLQWSRADFYNPLSQFLVRITQPALQPLRRFIPAWGGVDIAAIVLMIILQIIALSLLMAIAGVTPRIDYLLLRAPAELISLLLNVYLIAIVVRAILSWVSPNDYNPATTVLLGLTEPVIRPFRAILPDLGGIDLSPLAAIVAIQVVKMLVLPPLDQIAPGLMM